MLSRTWSERALGRFDERLARRRRGRPRTSSPAARRGLSVTGPITAAGRPAARSAAARRTKPSTAEGDAKSHQVEPRLEAASASAAPASAGRRPSR